MPQRLRLPAAVVAAIVIAEAAVLLLRPKERYPVVEADPRAYFSATELQRAVDFRSGQLWLFGARTAVELAVLIGAVKFAPRAGKRPVVTGAAAAVALTLATTTAALPLRAAARQRAKDVGLITQSWGGWAADTAKSTAITSVFAAGGGALLVVGLRRFGRDWWAPGAAAVAGFAVVFSYLGPVALDPIFNRFEPLPAGETRDDVLELARKAGVDVGEVYEVDASRRTTAANAYVTGLGTTKRVVLYDTLLKDFTPAETRLVVAHELGHVKHKDVPGGLLWLALVAPFGTLVVARVAERLTKPGATAVPATVLALALVAPVLTAISNQLSRAIERRADAFALELTNEPEAMIGFERRITVKNVGDPDPPRWQQLLLATHPTTMERIGAALARQLE
ncbi:M48 family metalloprotease [Solirubrobacter sp. CPCC 204708]|uniref:M48 family metalloprotease n=1 Tax=Solirubrobacter deserti TaxID=2282478 RepID=A0ABT4RPC3_9ACTN|nr:M48 family metalloprotease [Solirubrobacter deserti]MBE2319984.1 M48 family metalloprotease [Solirubrobacter deserti]MDA0140419.1 M48 family metalloprotease [Solirubrobacter deserti]